MIKDIGEFQLIDHGPYDHVVIGVGDNPSEALDDCLEQMAKAGFDTTNVEDYIEATGTLPIVSKGTQCSVSIKWNQLHCIGDEHER